MRFKQGVEVAVVAMGLVAALVAAAPGISSTIPNTGAATQMVVTVLPSSGAHGGSSGPTNLGPGDLVVQRGHTRVPIIGLQRLAGDLGDMQLFILLDDSTRSSSLGIQLPELKKFIESLPPATQVGIGYMRNGSAALAQEFTADHEIAASALRLPEAVPGGNGSPYFALSDLVKHWPSKQPTDRRAVLMLTDGVDRYYGSSSVDDPYVDAAAHDALIEHVMVYSIYLRGAGVYGRGEWTTNVAQSRLLEVSEETGGHGYFQDFTDPVTISPFLSDLDERFDNQYQVTMESPNEKGVQRVTVRTEVPRLKIQAPTRIYVR
jgi:hypothetical protein